MRPEQNESQIVALFRGWSGPARGPLVGERRTRLFGAVFVRLPLSSGYDLG